MMKLWGVDQLVRQPSTISVEKSDRHLCTHQGNQNGGDYDPQSNTPLSKIEAYQHEPADQQDVHSQNRESDPSVDDSGRTELVKKSRQNQPHRQ